MLKLNKVLDYDFVNNTMDELVNEVHSRIEHSHKTFIVTANPEIITYAQSHPSYKKTLKRAEYIIPDGIGVILASKILGTPLHQRLAGFDLMERLLQISDKQQLSIYFLGTKPNIIDLTVANIHKVYPSIKIVGFHHGYFKGKKHIKAEIKEKNPDIVFVGLGFPKQEKWISENLHYFNKGIFIGLGGCFNVWAGVDKRAPKIWRNLNVEWLYRLVKQPSRFKRMIAIPIFLKAVSQYKFHSTFHFKHKQLKDEHN